MTIRHHLFILITALILAIATAQVFLMLQFKNQIEDEVEQRSRRVVDRLLDITMENLDRDANFVFIDQPDRKRPHGVSLLIKITNQEQSESFWLNVPRDKDRAKDKISAAIKEQHPDIADRVARLSLKVIDKDIYHISRSLGKSVIEISQHKDFSNKNFRRYFKKHLSQAAEKNLKDFRRADRDGTPPLANHRHNKRDKSNPKFVINKLFNHITLIIIITSLIAVILVFWLSKKLSSPLQNLSGGFKQLEQGKFGTKVAVEGVSEMRYAIEQFNHMSDKLVQLAEAEAKLQQQSHLQEIGDVAKGIAHALRNPLHTIGLALEQLKDDSLPESVKEKLRTNVQNKIQQLDKNIQALMTLTSGELERRSEVDLRTLLNDVILELKQSHIGQDSKLNVSLLGEEHAFVQGEINELRSVLHTLVFNAYESAKGASDPIELTIDLQKTTSGIHLSVSDNGLGIDPSIENDLFSPHISSKPEGAGMGLYIAQRIMKLYYGGEIALKNNPEGQGAIATCTFTDKAIEE